MLELFTGQIPFFYLGDTTSSIYKTVPKGEFPERPLDKDVVARGLDDRMWGLMEKCWNITPAQRPSATKILRSLEAALRARPQEDGDSEASASSRPRKRARVAEQSVKVEDA